MRAGAAVLMGMFAAIFGGALPAMAEPIAVNVQIVAEDGSPLHGLEVRLIVGSEPDSRTPDAGAKLTTNAEGRVTYAVDAPIISRSVSLDNFFVRHPSQLVEVGLEMDMLGRRLLYWLDLDFIKGIGPAINMTGYIQDDGGNFSRPLAFDSSWHNWRFPDQPNGMLMTNIGVDIVEHSMSGEPGGTWAIDLVIEKKVFEVR